MDGDHGHWALAGFGGRDRVESGRAVQRAGDAIPTADTVVELVRQQAARLGEKAAFSFSHHGDGRAASQVTYRGLDAWARAIGSQLQGLGASGQRVLVLCGPGLDGIAGVFGCLYAGAIAVPVAQRVGPRLALVIADAGAGFAVASARLPPSIRGAVDAAAGGLRGGPVVWCGTDDGDPDAWMAPAVDSDSIALIQYSAGPARHPAGVVVTHENVMAAVAAVAAAGLADSRDVVVSWLPTHHERGLIGTVLAPLYLGASTVLMAPSAFLQRPMCWLEAISRWRATVTMAPDSAYRWCVQRSTPTERAGLDLSTLSTAVINGGEPVRAATMLRFAEAFSPAEFRGDAFMPVYGRAEATMLVSGGSDRPTVCHVDRAGLASGWIAEAHQDDPNAVAVVGCGRPRQHVVIVDPATRMECGPDEVGEIWVGGPSVAQSYWGAPAASDQIFEAFLADGGGGPFLRTGDRGFVRGGELFVTGACPDLIVLDGVHYYPHELEATVADCHSVLLSGRGAVFTDDSEQLVVVHEARCEIGDAELATLVALIQSALDKHHGIQACSIVLVEAMQLPTGSGGEIRRGACRCRYLDGDLDALAHWYAGESLGAKVVELIRRQGACRS
ncbi:fatty acyl-AMP ligase [Mycobacterium sp. SVM_VP21]|nr:fatty acyl-AMP ligase [Mycobacterium sp. SVM_VP21]